MMSVIGIFDDPAQVVRRLLSLCSPNGLVFLFSPFNEEPIDVILSYRRSPGGIWESGYNLFSMTTMEDVCSTLGLNCSWKDFALQQPIAKGDDPMRSWTEPFHDKENCIIYGTNTFCTPKRLVIER